MSAILVICTVKKTSKYYSMLFWINSLKIIHNLLLIFSRELGVLEVSNNVKLHLKFVIAYKSKRYLLTSEDIKSSH